jgi:hypothetical protein
MKSILRSPLWTARELFFILLVSVFIDRIAAARAEQPVHPVSANTVTSRFCSQNPKATVLGTTVENPSAWTQTGL